MCRVYYGPKLLWDELSRNLVKYFTSPIYTSNNLTEVNVTMRCQNIVISVDIARAKDWVSVGCGTITAHDLPCFLVFVPKYYDFSSCLLHYHIYFDNLLITAAATNTMKINSK